MDNFSQSVHQILLKTDYLQLKKEQDSDQIENKTDASNIERFFGGLEAANLYSDNEAL